MSTSGNKKKAKVAFGLAMASKPNIHWRPQRGLLAPTLVNLPKYNKGYPVLDSTYDPMKKDQVKGFRVYKPPKKPVIVKTDYDETNWHEMVGKFRFEITGEFAENAEPFEKEIFTAADDLYLVGWIKARKRFCIGHLQGDAYALSYMQKWLRERHASTRFASIHSVHFYDESYGLPELKYGVLKCIKDWRKFGSRKSQMIGSAMRAQVYKMEEDSRRALATHERFIEENQVKDY